MRLHLQPQTGFPAGSEETIMNRKIFSGIMLTAVLMMAVLLCPSRADAATVIYVRKGVTGNITFNSAPVPNAKWKVKKSSILKLKSSTSKKAVYTGKKVGKTTLTAYNKYNPSQKMDITVYVMPSGKLNKMDFQCYGSVITDQFGRNNGSNWIDYTAASRNGLAMRIVLSNNITASNSGRYFETCRTAKLLDPYSRVCMLYGKKSLKKFKKTERYYKNVISKISGGPGFFSQNIRYYTDYKYGKNYCIRFVFNSAKKVTLINFFKNYEKL